jgi:hypothetical protein
MAAWCVATSAALVAGCEPESLRLRFVSATDPGVERLVPVATTGVTSALGSALGPVANDVGAVGYRLEPEQRLFLFQQDLAEGVTSGDRFLAMPQPAGAAERVGALPTKDWQSARVDDLGLCSLTLPSVALPAVFDAALSAALSSGTEGSPVTRVVAPRVSPRLRSRTVSAVDDSLRVRNARYRIARVPVRDGRVLLGVCRDVTVTLGFEIGVTWVAGVATSGPQRGPSLSFAVRDGFTWDYLFDVRSAEVTVNAPGCVYAQAIRGALERSLREGLGDTLAARVTEVLTVDPRTLGVRDAEVLPCRCDGECSGAFTADLPAYLAGSRGRCMEGDPAVPGGECWVRFEADRLHVSPRGLHLVYAEDPADPQADLAFAASAAGGARETLSPDGPFLPSCEPDRSPYVDPDDASWRRGETIR